MTVVMNLDTNDYCRSITSVFTPTEWLIVRKALENMANDEATHKADKVIIKHMLNTDMTIEALQAQPNYNEWCTDCKEYNHEKHCCPRFNKVIQTTLEEMRSEQPVRARGYWMTEHAIDYMQDDVYRCSRCGHYVSSKRNMCPECKAEMEVWE